MQFYSTWKLIFTEAWTTRKFFPSLHENCAKRGRVLMSVHLGGGHARLCTNLSTTVWINSRQRNICHRFRKASCNNARPFLTLSQPRCYSSPAASKHE